MSDAVSEWLAKAEGDYKVAEHELVRADEPIYDAVCYHAQQCIEKLMKGLLVKHGQTPPFTHDLVTLHHLIAERVADWSCPIDDLRFLSLAAVQYRYPGDSAERSHAERSWSLRKTIRTRLRSLIEPRGGSEPLIKDQP